MVFDSIMLSENWIKECVFCVRKKIKSSDALKMLTVAFSEYSLNKSNVYK